jgi:hypothetical protein
MSNKNYATPAVFLPDLAKYYSLTGKSNKVFKSGQITHSKAE